MKAYLCAAAVGGAICVSSYVRNLPKVSYHTSTERDKVQDIIDSFEHLRSDRALTSILYDIVVLFEQIDTDATRGLLVDIDSMVYMYTSLLRGESRPGAIAYVLRLRRAVKNRIGNLVTITKRTRPTSLTYLIEDIRALYELIESYVHNCEQQSNLNISELVECR